MAEPYPKQNKTERVNSEKCSEIFRDIITLYVY